MPGYLLDTCAWIDALLAPERLAAEARDLIAGPEQFGLCPISLLELARKESRGDISLRMAIRDWFEQVALPAGKIRVLPITPEIAIDATRLPEPFLNRQGKHHKDPADQIIVATARYHGATLITSDRVLLDYQFVNTLSSRA
ncbi:MAG: type II toxin-antitoxin system VapC family toxin [Verrucomicrobiales bacterium]